MLSYINFLILNCFKKLNTWVTLIVYWLVYFLILIILPLAFDVFNKNPLYLWTNSIASIQVLFLFIIGTFSVTEAIIVFKDHREDGTDILVIAKPLKRWQIIFSKFTTYIIVSLVAIFGCIFIALFTACFPHATFSNAYVGIQMKYYGPLIGSIFFGNMISMILFGVISVIISLFFNKVGTIAIVESIVIIMYILNISFSAIVDSPINIANKKGIDIKTKYYYDIENQEVNQVALFDFAEYNGDLLQFDASQFWKDCNDKSFYAASKNMDIAAQLASNFKSFGLTQTESGLSEQLFGYSADYNFVLDDNIIKNIPFIVNPVFDSKMQIPEIEALILCKNPNLTINDRILYSAAPKDNTYVPIPSSVLNEKKIKGFFDGLNEANLYNDFVNLIYVPYNQLDYKNGTTFIENYIRLLNDNENKGNDLATSKLALFHSYNFYPASDQFKNYFISFFNNNKNIFLNEKVMSSLGISAQKESDITNYFNNILYPIVAYYAFYYISDLQKQLLNWDYNWLDHDIVNYYSQEDDSNKYNQIQDPLLKNILILLQNSFYGLYNMNYLDITISGDGENLNYEFKDNHNVVRFFAYTERAYNNIRVAYSFHLAPFYNQTAVILSWSFLCLFLYALSYVVYQRIDFK